MHVEFVGQDLKRHAIMFWPRRRQRPCLVDDGFWRGPSAGIPGAECFERDTKSRGAAAWDRPSRVLISRNSDAIDHDDAIGPGRPKANGWR